MAGPHRGQWAQEGGWGEVPALQVTQDVSREEDCGSELLTAPCCADEPQSPPPPIQCSSTGLCFPQIVGFSAHGTRPRASVTHCMNPLPSVLPQAWFSKPRVTGIPAPAGWVTGLTWVTPSLPCLPRPARGGDVQGAGPRAPWLFQVPSPGSALRVCTCILLGARGRRTSHRVYTGGLGGCPLLVPVVLVLVRRSTTQRGRLSGARPLPPEPFPPAQERPRDCSTYPKSRVECM